MMSVDFVHHHDSPTALIVSSMQITLWPEKNRVLFLFPFHLFLLLCSLLNGGKDNLHDNNPARQAVG